MKPKNELDISVLDSSKIDGLIPVKNDLEFAKNNEELVVHSKNNNNLSDEEMNNDLRYSRDTLYKVIETGIESLDNLSRFLNQTVPGHTGYDSLVKLMDSLRQASTSLANLNVNKKNSEIQKPNKVINNTLQLTSDDVQKILKQNKK